MHCKIIALSRDPITPYEHLLSEYDCSEYGFIPWIGDYCTELTAEDSANVIDDWCNHLKNTYGNLVEITASYILFRKGFKEKYTENLVRVVKDYVMREFPKDLDSYSSPGMMVYRLKRLLDDQLGLYIYDGHFNTEDDFFRELEPEVSYFFGNVIDYHY